MTRMQHTLRRCGSGMTDVALIKLDTRATMHVWPQGALQGLSKLPDRDAVKGADDKGTRARIIKKLPVRCSTERSTAASRLAGAERQSGLSPDAVAVAALPSQWHRYQAKRMAGPKRSRLSSCSSSSGSIDY